MGTKSLACGDGVVYFRDADGNLVLVGKVVDMNIIESSASINIYVDDVKEPPLEVAKKQNRIKSFLELMLNSLRNKFFNRSLSSSSSKKSDCERSN